MSAPASSLTGLALALVLVGVLVATAASIAALVMGDQRLMLIASAGFAMQFLGWRRQARQNGGVR